MQALYDVPAPAKLNLFLHVVGKRDDGYHLLQSLFVLIDWADSLHFERRSDGQIHRHDLGGSGEPLPADDLCVRAARALQAATGCTLGADIQLDKRLPSGAGMGGGSSDAASTLLALNRLWGLGLKRAQLAEIGLRLGADVPFFIGGRNAFVEGIGERLTPLDLGAELCLVVLKPKASIATKEIFSSKLLQRSKSVAIVAGFPAHNSSDAKNSDEAVDARSEKQVENLRVIGADRENCLQDEQLEQVSIEQMLKGFGRNDLQRPAEAASTEVVQALALLQERFGNSRMTGSGSAVFAQACRKTGSDASFMATMLEDLPPGWTGRMCRSLQAHPLVDWAED